jgi:aryl-alcohol dehydrogenase-like predicted oxidoreductase
MLPIPGTASAEHLEENLRARSIELDAEEVERLEAAA